MNEQNGQSAAASAAMGAAGERGSWWSALGWAAYLACSWTWCIGMFLPVLLVRDYGIWGFVVFAVPNVVGAGAMGWVLRSGTARALASQHRVAIGAFSYITAVFQIVFLFWLSEMGRTEANPTLVQPISGWLVVGGLIVLYALIWALSRICSSRAMPVILWCVSFGIAVYLVATGKLDVQAAVQGVADSHQSIGALWLAPVCAFGFLLCPYLDATFLTASYSQTDRDARTSFTLGFGVLFLAMILFTLLYAPLFIPETSGARATWPVSIAMTLVTLHIFLQLAYTTYLHVWGVIATAGTRSNVPKVLLLIAAIGLGLLAWSRMIGDLPSHAGLSGGEIIYRCFMSFYGLVFPAYVWLCMIPTRDGHSGVGGAAGRRKLVVLGVACVVAAPCYWMGFIERVEWWLGVGLGVVLVARVVVRGRLSGGEKTI